MITLQQDEKYLENDYWSWSVWLDGTPAELDEVQEVIYILHTSFRDPVRIVKDRATAFRMKTAGWGVFPLRVNVVLKDGREIHLKHDIQLHYPNGELTTA